MSTLDEVVPNFAVSNGKITLQNYFQPYEYIGMDARDRESPNAVFGGAGSYPLEVGYIYYTPAGEPLLVYKHGLDQRSASLFSKLGQSPENSAGRGGIGVPTFTTYNSQTGTGIV